MTALREWHLGYVNHAGAQDRIQVEINFLMRAYALPPRVLAAAPAIGAPPCEFLVLAAEEVFGGKIKAMIDRRYPRDLYDLFRFAKSGLPHDAEILRKLAVLLMQHHDCQCPRQRDAFEFLGVTGTHCALQLPVRALAVPREELPGPLAY